MVAPTDLAALTVSETEVDLFWTDTNLSESGCEVQRSIDGTNFSSVTDLPENAVGFSDSGLSPGVAYTYRVRAIGLRGWVRSAFSQPAATFTFSLAPTVPTSVYANRQSPDTVEVSWTHDQFATDFYTIQRSVDGGAFHDAGTVDAINNSFIDYAAIATSTYEYLVLAANTGGRSPASAPSPIVPSTQPTPVSGTQPWQVLLNTISAPTADTVSLDYTVTVATQLELEWKEPGDVNFKLLASVDGGLNLHTLVVQSLQPKSRYGFRLKSVSDGLVHCSDLTADTPPLDAAANGVRPATPVNLQLGITPNPATTTWDVAVHFEGPYGPGAMTGPRSDFASNLSVVRVDDPSGVILGSRLLGGADKDATGYVAHATVSDPGTTYIFRERVMDRGDSTWSQWSSPVTYLTPGDAIAPVVLSTAPQPFGTVAVTCPAAGLPATAHVQIFRLVGGVASELTTVDASLGIASVQRTATGGQLFAVYEYDGHHSTYSNFADGEGKTVAPAAPTNLSVYVKVNGSLNTSDRLVWDNLSNDETSFSVEWSTDSMFQGNLGSATVSADQPYYSDRILGNNVGVGYFYRVRALRNGTASDWSNVATVAPTPVIVGFYGAQLYFVGMKSGNVDMAAIGGTIQARGYQQKTFNSRAYDSANDWDLEQLDTNHDGDYDPANGDQQRDIKIYVHSWGGISAIILAQRIESSSHFKVKSIKSLATIDPVKFGRFTDAHVHRNVQSYRNWYQTGSSNVNILGIGVHGYQPTVDDSNTTPHPHDLNLNPSDAEGVNHFSIVKEVEGELYIYMGL